MKLCSSIRGSSSPSSIRETLTTRLPARSKEWVETCTLIVPWPVLYETINTRLARRPETISRFESLIRRPDAILLDDSPYRQDAYEDTLERAKKPNSPKSLVDSILYAIIEDPNVRIDAMLTFNLRDFGSVCQSNRVELL